MSVRFDSGVGNAVPNRFSLSVVIGVALLLVPVLFVAANVLEYELGIPIGWNPFRAIFSSDGSSSLAFLVNSLIVLGPIIGIVALAAPLIRVRWKTEDWEMAMTVTVQRSGLVRLWIIVFGMITIATLVTYLVAENLPCLLGRQTTC